MSKDYTVEKVTMKQLWAKNANLEAANAKLKEDKAGLVKALAEAAATFRALAGIEE